MYCDHCGNDIADDSVFCKHCGKTLSTAQAPPYSQAKPKSEQSAPKKEKKPANLFVVLAVAAIAFVVGKFVIAPSMVSSYQTPAQEQTESHPEITITVPETPDLNFPVIPDTGDGSQHAKLFKFVGNSGTIKCIVTYCEGTYNGAPDDTVLGLDIETEYNRTYPVDSSAVYLRQTAKEILALNNSNFSWRDNSNDYYYNIDFSFDRLETSDSAELIPYVVELLELPSYGNTLKMSQLEDSLLSQDYIITYAD